MGCNNHQLLILASSTLIVFCSFAHVTGASYVSRSRRKVHLRRASNDTSTGHMPESKQGKNQYGDLTCMRWSGGTCRLSACKSDRGPTTCTEGKCFCNFGHCATSAGICETSKPGEWIGSYSIRFVNAYNPSQPYLGIEPDVSMLGNEYDSMASVANSQPQWKLVHTTNGFVRFESIFRPGHVFAIYNSRRRAPVAFLQRRQGLPPQVESPLSKNLTSGTHMNNSSHLLNTSNDRQTSETRVSDDSDLWPRLQTFEDTSPIDASFQVRDMPGKGLEIWDPHWKVSVASADRNGWFQDDSADHGVAECYPEGWFFSGCENRELVVFEPTLPAGVATSGSRVDIETISTWKWWHWVLMIVAIIACLAAYRLGLECCVQGARR